MDKRKNKTMCAIVKAVKQISKGMNKGTVTWEKAYQMLQDATDTKGIARLEVMSLEDWIVVDECVMRVDLLTGTAEKCSNLIEMVTGAKGIGVIEKYDTELPQPLKEILAKIIDDIMKINTPISTVDALALFDIEPIKEQLLFKRKYPFVWENCEEIRECVLYMLEDMKMYNRTVRHILTISGEFEKGGSFENIVITNDDLI